MKTTKILGAAMVAATALTGVSLNGSASAASVQIDLLSDTDFVCRFYSDPTLNTTTCDSSYGSYNSSSRTLTLGSKINSTTSPHLIITMGDSPVTVAATSNIEASIQSLDTPIIFNFGNYTFTDIDSTKEASGYGYSCLNSDVTFKSGTFGFNSQGCSMKALKVNGGTVNYNAGPIIASTFDIDNGTVNFSGINVDNSFNMTNGTVNIVSNDAYNIFGITLEKAATMTMAGGNLNIDGFSVGIEGFSDNKINFNGGSTTIKNSTLNSIFLDLNSDPENSITFGKNVGMKEEATYVFYDDDSTGIAAPNGVTIAEGYTNQQKHYGLDWLDGDDSINNVSSTVKTPNTGTTTGENNAKLIMTILALPIIAMVGFGAAYLKKRLNHRVKFSK